MQSGRFRSWTVLIAFAFAAGCAGNGEGLNANGQPITPGGGTGGGPVTADFQSIQENVFTPICSVCHVGASAPQGLQLDAAHSYSLLVGVPSNEDSSLLRVNPGNPDQSYMVLKIEGAPGIVGGRMPLGETPLPQATINAIRQWISNGAPNAPTAMAAAQTFAVQTTAPLDSAVVKAPLRRVVVAFSQELDASLINDTTVALERIGTERERIPVAAALAEHNPAVLLMTPRAPLAPGLYRATLRGTGGGALANLSATTLGADISFQFTVEAGQ